MDSNIMNIARELRSNISRKYIIRDFKLFGSSARGDRRGDSDIDILIRLPEINPAIEQDLFDMAYDMELAHDCLIDLIAVSDDDMKNHAGKAPVYRNIISEGIAL